VAFEAFVDLAVVARGGLVRPGHHANPAICMTKVELVLHGDLTVFVRLVRVVGSFTNENLALWEAPVAWSSGEWIELVATLGHPRVVMDGSEAESDVVPPVTLTPMALRAVPLETGGADCGFDPGLGDLMIASLHKVLHI